MTAFLADTRGMRLALVAAIGTTAAGAVGCERADRDQPCPPLTITVDGVPLALPYGRAVTRIEDGRTSYFVTLYNHDDTSCREVVAGLAWVRDGERSLFATAGGLPGVGTDRIQRSNQVAIEQLPTELGEPMAICVRQPVTFTAHAGPLAGHTISAVGAFVGAFCGTSHP